MHQLHHLHHRQRRARQHESLWFKLFRRLPGIVPGPDPRPVGLGTICPTSRNQRGEALHREARQGGVQPDRADPLEDLSVGRMLVSWPFLIVGGVYAEVALQKREVEGTVHTKHQLT